MLTKNQNTKNKKNLQIPAKLSLKILLNLPKEVRIIFDIFADQIFLVGGSVRDIIIGREIKDYDFATILKPSQIIKILAKNNIKSVDINAKFGTIIAIIGDQNFQITTFRSDKNFDGRHCEVDFSQDIKEDAARRDFTINAIYLDSKGKIYDFFSGVEDLKKNHVRFINNASDRIKEDYLRILRFFRFSGIYSDNFDQKAINQIKKLKSGLAIISKERIRDEFLKILAIEDIFKIKKTFLALNKSGVSEEIFSEKINLNNFVKLKKIVEKSGYKKKLFNASYLICLFYYDNFNVENFFSQIRATKNEKKFINFFIKKSAKNILEIKLMLLNCDKDFLLNFYFLSLLFKRFSRSKKQIIGDVNFIEKFSIVDFPITAKNIIDLGFKGSEIEKKLRESFKIWLKGNINKNN
jgi:poly(A) polymerase